MSFSAEDARHMARALQLARRGLYTTDPNPRVGCVIVNNHAVVGEAWHARAGEPHAEVLALRAAGAHARGADVYTTLEPCCHHGRTPPCTEALSKSGVRRVVAAMRDPNPAVAGKGFAALTHAGIANQVGLMQAPAEALNPGFIARMTRVRPYVRIKLAASLDGRTALANGESRWITSDAARADVQRWRARSSAIMTGIGTLLADDPALTVRAFDIGRAPMRIVVDGKLRTPVGAQVLRVPGRTLLATASDDTERTRALITAGAEVVRFAHDRTQVDLAALLAYLADQEINEVLVEAGTKLSGALLEQRLADEIIGYFAPHIMGDAARGMFHLPALARMADRIALAITDVRTIGKDLRVVAKVTTTGTN